MTAPLPRRIMENTGREQYMRGEAMADEKRSEKRTPSSPGSRPRGGSPSAIAEARQRTPHPGPQHWGGPRPRRSPQPDPFFSPTLTPPPRTRLPDTTSKKPPRHGAGGDRTDHPARPVRCLTAEQGPTAAQV